MKKMKSSMAMADLALRVLLGMVMSSVFLATQSPGQALYEPGMVRSGTRLRAPLSPPVQSQPEAFWEVEPGIRLHHFTRGKGRTVLVIHGGPGRPQQSAWAGLERLTNACRFVYYDQRGCGQSTRPVDHFASPNYYENLLRLDASLGLGTQLADIERIRRLVGEERLILIGHSFGGFLAALYAAEFPTNVASMVLVAPADVLVSPSPNGGLFEQVRSRLPLERRGDYDGWLKRYFDFQTIFSKDEAALVGLNEEFGKYYRSVTSGDFPQPGKTGGWIAHALYFSMGRQHDYRPALKNVLAPVLVIHGGRDIQPEAASREYTRAFPNARMRTIEGAEHFPFHTHPAEFAAAVAEFVSECAASGPPLKPVGPDEQSK